MNAARIEEIQKACAYPESHSVAQALYQVWNECSKGEQEALEAAWARMEKACYGQATRASFDHIAPILKSALLDPHSLNG